MKVTSAPAAEVPLVEMLLGQMMTGSSVSLTSTSNLHSAVKPAASVIIYRTSVVPAG